VHLSGGPKVEMHLDGNAKYILAVVYLEYPSVYGMEDDCNKQRPEKMLL